MIGQTLGHYRIIEKVGAGGMGEVYRARDERLERDVALKILPRGSLADKAARARLLQEAQTASALNHPHICTIYEVGEAGGQTYIVMEYVEGRPLSAIIGAEGAPLEAITRSGMQIADALAHAHDRGIVHRDLKSSNVLITREGRAKVLDFGLAKRLPEVELTQATRSRLSLPEGSGVVGTLHYMAPEVLRGEPADPRSDLWALGVLLYEMAAGQLPFQGKTAFELSSAILREAPRPLPPRVSAGLGGVIQRCLAKEPGQRYQRASELCAALEAVQSEVAIAPVIPTTRRASRAINSLAVLPFENATADLEAEYLSDGITESLIQILAQLPKLRVMARSTVFRYKGQPIDPLTVGRELNVRAVLTGRVSQRGESLIITTELVDAANGWQLWGEQYNRKLVDIFAVQDEIAKQISERLRLRLTKEDKKRLAKHPTKSTEAYQLYLKGRYYWNKRTEEDLKRGIGYFNQAIEKDPNYALAFAGLADSYYLLGNTAYGALSPKEALPKARTAALKALQIDDTLAEVHASLASVLMSEGDWQGAGKEYKRAIKLNPRYATARHWYALYLMMTGRLEAALAEAKRAQELDPLSAIINRDSGLIFYYARQFDRAIERYRETLELDPNFALTHQALGRAYLAKGMYEEAVEEMQKAVSLSRNNVAMSAALAHAYAVSGKIDKAKKILGDLMKQSKRSYVSPISIAVIYAGLGKNDQVLEWLEKAYAEHNPGLHTLKVHPIFDNLRSAPRFRDLLRRIGLLP